MADIQCLVEKAFTEEACRRICRRAGITSIGRKEYLSLNEQIRTVALLMLRNICSKIVVFIEHKRVRTLDTDVVRHALQSLSVKLPRYTSNPEEFEPCKVFKKERTKASTKSAKKRGNVAEAERDFEQQNLDCLYMERAPFARLLHSVLIAVYSEERLDVTGPEQLKMSKRAVLSLALCFRTADHYAPFRG